MENSANLMKLRTRERLAPALRGELSPVERILLFKKIAQQEEKRIRLRHDAGAGGHEIATARRELLDILLAAAMESVARDSRLQPLQLNLCLCAMGGYGRGLLNPCSDIDLMFLVPRNGQQLSTRNAELIKSLLYLLWDIGYKIGHSVRSIAECVIEAKKDQQNFTALMDARLVAGDQGLFASLQQRFEKDVIQRGMRDFLELRREDLRVRHDKYSRTPFLQEPNVKESCGGLRDYHNVHWVARVKRGFHGLEPLVTERSLTATALREMETAHDFLLRVRNALHYESGKASDILTLRLQGVIATQFHYPQKSILRRTEAFMRDYYRHTRNMWQYCASLMEIFQIEEQHQTRSGHRSFLTFRKKKREEFDGFVARDGRIDAARVDVFEEDPYRLMRLFQHCQLRNLELSPPMRKLVKANRERIDRPFRYAKANRDTFQAILERKGDVARTLRNMHRVDFLGAYLPEFGALDCLVQHEFFHRYTADEHTLRCIDQLDALLASNEPKLGFYRRLLLDISDPYALYMAMILHDTGRAENVREHIDGSAMLAAKLCKRLQITGSTRNLIMFLVDHHLSFWRTATAKNIEDPEVIAEFAAIMKNRRNLDALMLFTYADSNATAPDAWSSWKESLMRQLHALTARFLEEGKESYAATLNKEKNATRKAVLELMREDYHPWVKEHFQRMPATAFSFRLPAHIVTQVRTVRHFRQREDADQSAYCIKWIDYLEKGYTELIVATRDRPKFLEKICCALASEQINILSADFYTRTDGIVLDVFRVCSTNFEPISDANVRQRFLNVFESIFIAADYQPAHYLKRRMNFLKPRTDTGIPFPVRSYISNDLHPHCTTIEIQALDRIGLLHDLFQVINQHGLTTVHARINTEKGAAIDTLYISDAQGNKVTDLPLQQRLGAALDEIIAREETS